MSEIKPAVAIITRTKDRPVLLSRAVESVSKQSFSDYILVIVNDGGSSEVVNDVVKKFQNKLKGHIKIIHNKKPLGMEGASNAGVKQSDSKYIAMLDDDDTWHPDFLKETVGFLESDSFYSGVVTQTELITEKVEGSKIEELSRQKFTPKNRFLTLFSLAGANQFTNNSFVYDRTAAKQVGIYNESLPVLGDWDFNVRFMKKFNVGLIYRPLAFYHRRAEAGKSDSMQNTGLETHLNYTARILNDELRTDLDKGRTSLGLIGGLASRLTAMDDSIEVLDQKIENLQIAVNEMQKQVSQSLNGIAAQVESMSRQLNGSLEFKIRRFIRRILK